LRAGDGARGPSLSQPPKDLTVTNIIALRRKQPCLAPTTPATYRVLGDFLVMAARCDAFSAAAIGATLDDICREMEGDDLRRMKRLLTRLAMSADRTLREREPEL
jgi:hypothetical protein